MQDGWKEAHMPKTSSIRSAVSIEHRLVTDRRTWLVPRMHSIARWWNETKSTVVKETLTKPSTISDVIVIVVPTFDKGGVWWRQCHVENGVFGDNDRRRRNQIVAVCIAARRFLRRIDLHSSDLTSRQPYSGWNSPPPSPSSSAAWLPTHCVHKFSPETSFQVLEEKKTITQLVKLYLKKTDKVTSVYAYRYLDNPSSPQCCFHAGVRQTLPRSVAED